MRSQAIPLLRELLIQPFSSCFMSTPFIVSASPPTASNVATRLRISRYSCLFLFFLLLLVGQSACLNAVCSYLPFPAFRGHIRGMCTTPVLPQYQARLHTRL